MQDSSLREAEEGRLQADIDEEDNYYMLLDEVEGPGEDLDEETTEQPKHTEEFDVDCFSQTTKTNRSGGLTPYDPFEIHPGAERAWMVHPVDEEEPERVWEEVLQLSDGVLHDREGGWGKSGAGNTALTNLPVWCRNLKQAGVYKNPVS